VGITVAKNARFHLTDDGRLEVYAAKLATSLNILLKTYENGEYRFKQGEEAVFKVPKKQDLYDQVIKLLGVK
jgi:hypothetical protein